MGKSNSFRENELLLLMKEMNDYLFNEENKCLVECNISERTVCGCIKEYLDLYFKNTVFNVDLEYNKKLEQEHEKVLIDINKDKINQTKFRFEKNSDKKIIVKQLKDIYINKLNMDKESNKTEYDKKIIPDIIVHKRGTNEKNLLLIEVKKSSYYSKTDLVKLALIKKHSGLNYCYYIYFEYCEDKDKTEVYYMDDKSKECVFKKLF